MLGKLFKYDMKALSRVLLPLHVGVVGLGLLACVCGFAGYSLNEAAADSGVTMAGALLALVVMFDMLGIFAATIATIAVIIHRYYKNLFTDEGYLTLTLPATANQIVLSKVLSGLLCLLVDMLVVFASATIAFMAAAGFVGAGVDDALPFWMLSAFGGGLSGYGSEWLSALLGAFGAVLQVVMTLLLAYASFALGAVLAERHKVAAGIGLYLAVSWAIGLVGTFWVAFASSGVHGAGACGSSIAAMATTGLAWAGSACVAAGCYALCVHLIERRVDLS